MRFTLPFLTLTPATHPTSPFTLSPHPRQTQLSFTSSRQVRYASTRPKGGHRSQSQGDSGGRVAPTPHQHEDGDEANEGTLRDPPYAWFAFWVTLVLGVVGGVSLYLISYIRKKESSDDKLLQLLPVAGKEGVWRVKYQFQRSIVPVALSTNMFVMRVDEDTDSPGLLVYNPVAPAYELMEQLSQLGLPVRYVVVPNREHRKYLLPFLESNPGAIVFVPPGQSMSVGDQLKYVQVAYRIVELTEDCDYFPKELDFIPIGGIPRINEVALHHKKQKILFLCDTMTAISDQFVTLKDPEWVPLSLRYARWRSIYNRIAFPPALTRMVEDREALMKSLKKCLALDVDLLLCAHGEEDVLGISDPLLDWIAEWEMFLDNNI